MGLIFLICFIVFMGIVLIAATAINKIIDKDNRDQNYLWDEKPDENDWLYRATKRQQARYEYSDPVKPKKWVYNERARMWVDGDQLEEERHRRAYEENRRKWQIYEQKVAEQEAEERRVQAILDEMHRPIYLTEEEKELAKQIKKDRSQPTYEKWKAAKLKAEEQKIQEPEKEPEIIPEKEPAKEPEQPKRKQIVKPKKIHPGK